jgi:hypothetical protein
VVCGQSGLNLGFAWPSVGAQSLLRRPSERPAGGPQLQSGQGQQGGIGLRHADARNRSRLGQQTRDQLPAPAEQPLAGGYLEQDHLALQHHAGRETQRPPAQRGGGIGQDLRIGCAVRRVGGGGARLRSGARTCARADRLASGPAGLMPRLQREPMHRLPEPMR